MSVYELARLPRITAGVGARERIAALAGAGGAALLVADPGLKASGIADEIAGVLRRRGFGVSCSAPSRAIRRWRRSMPRRPSRATEGARPWSGSAAARRWTRQDDRGIVPAGPSAERYGSAQQPLSGRAVAKMCVPTTSGTGSETTRTAMLTRAARQGLAVGRRNQGRRSRARSRRVTKSLPPGLTAATGIDALVHAVEAATNRNASMPPTSMCTRRSGWSRAGCARVETPRRSRSARRRCSGRRPMAGVAIDNCGTAIAHALGHAMGSLRPIHHGRAVGVAMLASLPWNVEGNDAFGPCAAALGAEPSRAGFIGAYEKLLRAGGVKISLAEEFAASTPRRSPRRQRGPKTPPCADPTSARRAKRICSNSQARTFTGLMRHDMLDRPIPARLARPRRRASLEGRAFIDGAYVGALGRQDVRRRRRSTEGVRRCRRLRGRRRRPRRRRRAPRLREGRMARRRADAKKRVLLRFAELIREHVDEHRAS